MNIIIRFNLLIYNNRRISIVKIILSDYKIKDYIKTMNTN